MMSRNSNISVEEREVMQHAVYKADKFTVLRESGARPSLYQFLQMFWNEIAETKFRDNWHVKYLCDHLEEVAWRVARNQVAEKDLVINIPPGTTKTIICSIMFPAWAWSMGWYWMRFITASYSSTLALESAEKSRDLIRCDNFKKAFPDLAIKDDKDTKSNFRIGKRVKGRMKWGGNRFSTSVGGTLTGFHGHILIVDDPLNPEQAASEKELENCNRWMEQTLPTRKVDKEVSATVLIMQRLHESDPTGRIVKRKPDAITHVCLPGEILNYGEYLKPKSAAKYYKDGLLDPTRLGEGALKKLMDDLGQYGFAGQIGQNPAPPGGGMFKVDRMPVIDNFREQDIVQTVRYWDKAATESIGAAYTCGVKMSRLKNKSFVIHDVVRGQWIPDVREKMIRQVAVNDGVHVKIYMEQEPGSGGKESVYSSIQGLMGFAAYPDRPTGDKVRRADPFSVQVNISNVSLVKGDWIQIFKDELAAFPFGTFKDQVDASSAAFNILAAKKEARVLR